MIQAACCCNTVPCQSACAHKFFHQWTLECETSVVVKTFGSGECFAGYFQTNDTETRTEYKLDLAQQGTAYFTQGSRLRNPDIRGCGGSYPASCAVAFAGIPDLSTTGTLAYKREQISTDTFTFIGSGNTTTCVETFDDTIDYKKDNRSTWKLPITEAPLPCMNNTSPWIIPRISGRVVPGNLLAYRATGSDPECHWPNPGIYTGYDACEDILGAFDFSTQQRFTVTPYEGMEEDKFYFRRWTAEHAAPISSFNRWYWYTDEFGWQPISRSNNASVESTIAVTSSAGCFPDNTTYSEGGNDGQFAEALMNRVVTAVSYPGGPGSNPLFRDGNCGFKDHLLGIWSGKDGPPPSNAFGVNCVNSGPDPFTWEGGFGLQFFEGTIEIFDELAQAECPCIYPRPVRCDGTYDPGNECPDDPDDPLRYPRWSPWEAWNGLGGNSTGPHTIDVTYPIYEESDCGQGPGSYIVSGTIEVQLQFQWNLNIYNVVSSYDGVEIEAPCQ